MARPKSANSVMNASSWTQSSTAGPSTSPSRISNTTRGIASHRPTARVASGAIAAIAGTSTSVDRSTVTPMPPFIRVGPHASRPWRSADLQRRDIRPSHCVP